MRLGAIAQSLMERVALRMNAVPTPLLETQVAYSMARTIMAGVRLGIYEAVRDGASAAEVAAACGTDPTATGKLMDALVGCDYLRYRDGRFELTPKSRKWLLRDSPHSLADKLVLQLDEWEWVAQYEDYITTGQPLELHGSTTDPEYWGRYQRGMRSMAGVSAGEVARRLPVPEGATALLDIGGSHGYYSVCLCRRHAGLKATILDLPAAVEQAAPILSREGMGTRVVHRAGDALADDLGVAAWDVIFMSQLVHHFSEEQNRELQRRIAGALKPGGISAVVDEIRLSSPEAGAAGVGGLLDLYFSATSRSGTWPLETMQAWQRDAGLHVEPAVRLRTMPGAVIVVARKPRS